MCNTILVSVFIVQCGVGNLDKVEGDNKIKVR